MAKKKAQPSAPSAPASIPSRYSCPACGSSRHVHIMSMARNCNFVTVPHLGFTHDQGMYLPDLGFGNDDGDGFNRNICLDCGRVEGQFPVPDDELRATLAAVTAELNDEW